MFPHTTTDLAVLLALFDSPALGDATWETRYILLLWLSLVVMLPFPLPTLDHIALRYLPESSKERDGAVALLATYYSRPDSTIAPFLVTSKAILDDPASNDYLVSSSRTLRLLTCPVDWHPAGGVRDRQGQLAHDAPSCLDRVVRPPRCM